MKPIVQIDLQNDQNFSDIPEIESIKTWVEGSLLQSFDNLEQTIRVVDKDESRKLNGQFRGKNSPTNVLSFQSDAEHIEYDYLGDLVICHPVVIEEASSQGKELDAHWAHMIVHGMLHLQGLDHQNDQEASEMEGLEIKILSTLGYSSPYNDR